QAERGPRAAARGRGPRRHRSRLVQVRRGQLQGRLLPQEAPQLQRAHQGREAPAAAERGPRSGGIRRRSVARYSTEKLSITNVAGVAAVPVDSLQNWTPKVITEPGS